MDYKGVPHKDLPQPQSTVEAGTLKAWKLRNQYEKSNTYYEYIPALGRALEFQTSPGSCSLRCKSALYIPICLFSKRPSALQTDGRNPWVCYRTSTTSSVLSKTIS